MVPLLFLYVPVMIHGLVTLVTLDPVLTLRFPSPSQTCWEFGAEILPVQRFLKILVNLFI